MPRETLDRKILALRDEIIILSSMVENAIIESVEALRKQDLTASAADLRRRQPHQ